MNKQIEKMNFCLKSIIDIIKEDGVISPFEYIEEINWMIFLRLFDEIEIKKETEAQIT
jgi:hypothetical protein